MENNTNSIENLSSLELRARDISLTSFQRRLAATDAADLARAIGETPDAECLRLEIKRWERIG